MQMETTAPAYGWQALLARCEQWGRNWSDWRRSKGHQLTPDELPATFAPATEAQIADAEARIGIRLPPSVRAFYRQSNGHGVVGTAIWAVRSIEQLGWFRDVDPQMYDVLIEFEPWVARALLVSSKADASFWLLDPGEVDSRGEWRAGRWSSWNPGMAWIAKDFYGLFEHEVSTSEKALAKEQSPPHVPGTGRSRNERSVGDINSGLPRSEGNLARDGYTYVPAEGFTSVVTVSAPLTARVGEWVFLNATRRSGPWNPVRCEDVWPEEIDMPEPPIFEEQVAGTLSWNVEPKGLAKFNIGELPGTECGARGVMFSAPGVYTLQGHSAFPLRVLSNVITIRVEQAIAQ